MNRRIKLTIAYDGTNYHGWQIQPNAVTIEQVLNETLSKVTGEDVVVIGASRTDSGVHAMGNVAVFDTNSTIPTSKMAVAINTSLPDDIVIIDAVEVDSSFHPRYGNITKTYEYTIWKNKIPNPLRSRYTCYHYYDLDVTKIRESLECLIGEHDFASFCSNKSDIEITTRTIYNIDVEETEDEIKFRFIGDGFLYHMIRLIVGLAIKIGDNIVPVSEMKRVLEYKTKGYAKYVAPACGLCLMSIDYKLED